MGQEARSRVWIGLFEPSYELLSRIEAQLGLHYLAIEDAARRINTQS
jgi:Mg2+ and Co2+ transporter CorA